MILLMFLSMIEPKKEINSFTHEACNLMTLHPIPILSEILVMPAYDFLTIFQGHFI